MSGQKTETSELLLAKKLVRLLPGVARAPTDEEGNSRKCPRQISANEDWVRPSFAFITLLSNVRGLACPWAWLVGMLQVEQHQDSGMWVCERHA
jgi:hypothetical protein